MYLSLLIVFISIFLYSIANNLLNFFFANKSYDQYEELFASGENLDDSLIAFQKNHERNRFLGLRNVPDYVLDFILSRSDQHRAIKLYNIAKDNIFYSMENSTVEIKDGTQYIFDKNKSDNSELTVKEKSIAAYIFYTALAVGVMGVFSSKYNSDISAYYKEFILMFCFSILFLFIGASHVVKYQRLKCAKEFVDLG
ncbi:hypothetical protein MXM33_12285 [Acinetobacter vivianii]|uniref:hypothetical protein n=1 Tax=Acinetobacter vivianii TaxID=1776742 RepID=UPI002DBE11CF|nr:hypothetical protein [Acinetobacter vivianii]MEB6667797.1 hypothetical protein [Acinetobacter vivianii]